MDALTFLYWSLGIGWAALIVFLCVALIYVIRILRDVSNTTHVVANTVEVIDDNVTKITEKVAGAAEQITEYVVKPFTVAQYIAEKMKPFVDVMQQKSEEFQAKMEEEEEKPRKRRTRKKKK